MKIGQGVKRGVQRPLTGTFPWRVLYFSSQNRHWSRQKRAVSGDDFATEKDQFARRMSGDGFGDTARGDRE